MEKHPKQMTCEELYFKLRREGINDRMLNIIRGEKFMFELKATSLSYHFPCIVVACNALALESDLDGELLWLMVDDFNEFSAMVTNPVDRLHLKKFVKTHSATQAIASHATRSDDSLQGSLDQLMASFRHRNGHEHFTKVCTSMLRAPTTKPQPS